MEDIRFLEDLCCKIETAGYVSVQRNKGFTFEYKTGKERHSFIYVERGMLDYYFADKNKTIHIEKGEILFMPKRIPYKTEYLVDNTKIKIIVFDTDSASALPTSPITTKSVDISSIFESITLFNAYSSLYLTSKIYELLYILQNDTVKIPKKFKKIFPALKELKIKYYENNKVDFYAKMCNMSEPNFRKLFKAYTGCSPIDYRNRLRLSAVNRMLESGEFTVSEAAYLAGFNNMSFFYTIYHKASED